MVPETVRQKLGFARGRLTDLEALIVADKLGEPDARHQLTQEFVFHAVGATEYLAQLVNEHRRLGLLPENVAIHRVARELERQDPNDPFLVHLRSLTADPRNEPLPTDPYSDAGLIYRIINYRNEVVHRGINPFHFVLGAGPRVAFFWLDPRNHQLGQSTRSIDADLVDMFAVVDRHCCAALSIL